MGNYSEASRSISASQKGDWDSRCYKFPLNVKALRCFPIVFFFLYVQAHTPLRAQNEKCTTSWYHKSQNTNVGVLKLYGKHNPVSVSSEKIKKIRGR